MIKRFDWAKVSSFDKLRATADVAEGLVIMMRHEGIDVATLFEEPEDVMARVQADVAAFAADTEAHPHYETVRRRMGDLMWSGEADTLDAAYRRACREKKL